jgi:transcriptional regulator GlxA family with amidase domain
VGAGGAETGIPHSVAIVVYDGVALFELGVACDVFGGDFTTRSGISLYATSVCGAATAVTTDAGFEMRVPEGLDALRSAGTVVVPPTLFPDQVPASVLHALREASARYARIVSLCTGAFVLAAAGILDGLAATTHWAECAELARRYPLVSVDPGVLYIDNGDLLTSAGSAASIDLCLHLVQRDYGAEIATQVARDLVVPLQREGGQAQYIDTPLPEYDSGDSLFAGTLAWLREHLDTPVTVDDLAERSAMSPRTFARRFVASTGTTPYQWLVRERIRLARRLLETTGLPIETVARKSGFQTAGNLRKHFGRALHTTPQAYRGTFGSSAPAHNP